jgi:hypothetical protein
MTVFAPEVVGALRVVGATGAPAPVFEVEMTQLLVGHPI